MDENIQQFNSLFGEISLRDYEARFQNQNFIGDGSGSTVRSAYDTRHNRKVALKKLKRDYIKYQGGTQDVERQIRNYQVAEQIDTKCLFVRLYESLRVVDQQDSKHTHFYCLVLQLCDESLMEVIDTKQKLLKFSLLEKLKMCLSIGQGIKILHLYNIMHRDLKPANILIKYQGINKYAIKIADFGHTKQMSIQMTEARGSPQFVDPFLGANYGFEWDIYSLGLIYNYLLTGQFLFKIPSHLTSIAKLGQFKQFTKKKIIEIDKTLSVFQHSQRIKNMIKHCLIKDLKQRWNIEQVVSELEQIIGQLQGKQPLPPILKDKISTSHSSQPSSQQPGSNSKLMQEIQEQRQKNHKSKSSFESQDKVQSNISMKKNQGINNSQPSSHKSAKKIKQDNNVMQEIKPDKSKLQINGMLKLKMCKKLFKAREVSIKSIANSTENMKKLLIMNKFQALLNGLRDIQNWEIDQIKKKMILAFSFLYTKTKIRQEIKMYQNDEFLTENLFSLQQYVQSVSNPLLAEMSKPENQFKFNDRGRKILHDWTNFNSEACKSQLQNLLNSCCLHLKFNLVKVLC